MNRPALVMVHNKTLAAQLYQEFKRFFPENAVEYFVSYYDYYQPEAYVPSSDTYIEKEATDQRRDRPDAAVGHPVALRAARRHHRRERLVHLRPGLAGGVLRDAAAARPRAADRSRPDPPQAGGDPVRAQRSSSSGAAASACAATSSRCIPSYEDTALRIELFGDEVDELRHDRSAHRQGRCAATIRSRSSRSPISSPPAIARGWRSTRSARSSPGTDRSWKDEGKLLEAQRLHQRTMFDLEMITEIGYCHGIENYSRHLTGPRARASRRRRCSTTCRTMR